MQARTFFHHHPKQFLVATLVAAATPFALQAEPAGKGMLSEVMRLYGLNEAAAIDRLAKEIDATDAYRRLEAAPVPGYAGSWFDAESLTLKVATNAPDALSTLRHSGIDGVLVKYSFEDLKSARSRVGDIDRLVLGFVPIKGSYMDIRANRVVVVAEPGRADTVRALITTQNLPMDIAAVVEQKQTARTSANVAGATGTRNYTWYLIDEIDRLCSIGVSTPNGYLTAGHCGEENHDMRTSSHSPLGIVDTSTYFPFAGSRPDRGLVDTTYGWTPVAQIDGYSDGTINVPAKWGGMDQVPYGSTVCRYGQTSEGPHCGTISAVDYELWETDFTPPAIVKITGVTEVSGLCTQDGDSGGPVVAAGNQVQGIHVAGTPNSCPDDSTDVSYFQPIQPTLDALGETMLTTHGASIPSLSGYACPDMSVSGAGTYVCKFDHYNSQGATSVAWTKPGGSSSIDYVAGTCSSGQSVTVTLAVTNPYGTKNENRTFSCPMGPIP